MFEAVYRNEVEDDDKESHEGRGDGGDRKATAALAILMRWDVGCHI
jgi:hypothetical protein